MPRLKDIIKQVKELESYEYLNTENALYQHIIRSEHTPFLSLENSSDLNLQKPLSLSLTKCFFSPNIYARLASVFFLPALPGLCCIFQVLKNSQKFSLSFSSNSHFFFLLLLALLHENLAWNASPSGKPQAVLEQVSALHLRYINNQTLSSIRNRETVLSVGCHLGSYSLTISLSTLAQDPPPHHQIFKVSPTQSVFQHLSEQRTIKTTDKPPLDTK